MIVFQEEMHLFIINLNFVSIFWCFCSRKRVLLKLYACLYMFTIFFLVAKRMESTAFSMILNLSSMAEEKLFNIYAASAEKQTKFREPK